MLAQLALGAVALVAGVQAQVTATGTMGTTNPPEPTMGTPINQSSVARLLSVNAIDDFCLFAPPEPGATVGDDEAIMVAWCTQARNNARVIPDGTFSAVHIVRTPLYVQVQGWGDFTKMNIAAGDEGGELDPHGATGDGNPVGGNVTSNVSGSDVHYEEWMNYMSAQQFCIRICTAENSTYSAALECQHTLDEMGCNWVMPGDYTNNSFTDCQGDSAYPPGLYPQPDGSTSTFAQRYTGTYTAGGSVGTFTVGQTLTPQTPYSTPATSQCTTFSTISNGIPLSSLGVSGGTRVVSASGGSMTSGSTSSATGSASGSSASGSSASKSSAGAASGSASSSGKSGAAVRSAEGMISGSLFAGVFSVVAIIAGVGAVAL